MSEKPFPENLISGYVDGELTDEERARVERQMQADPETKRLIEELKANAGQFQSLPRFRSPDQFVERLMAGSTIDDAFAQLAKDESVRGATATATASVEQSPESSSTSRVGLAMAAIVSLAAMVLLALFLPGGLSTASLDLTVESAASMEKQGKSNSQQKSKQDANFKSEVDDDKQLFDAMKDDESVVFEAEDDVLNSGVELQKPRSAALRATNKSKDTMERSKQPSRLGVVASDEADGIAGNQPGVADAERLDREFGDNNESRLGIQKLSADKLQVVQEESQQLQRSLALNDIIEIEYPQGSEATAGFRGALSRNRIAIDDLEMEMPGVNEITGDMFKVTDASQVFVVTATPNQMAKLIKDVGRSATINRFRFGDLGLDQNRLAAVAQDKKELVLPSLQQDSQLKQGESPPASKGMVAGGEKNMERTKRANDQVIEGLAMRLMRRTRPMVMRDEVAPAESDETEGEEDALSFYSFGAANVPRQFLLLVRSNGTSGLTGGQSSSDQLDASELPSVSPAKK